MNGEASSDTLLSRMNPKLAGIVITISSLAMVQSAVAAGAGTHHPGAQYGARLAPEPFKSNSEACIGAMIPDLMRDHPVGHENHRAAGLLYTFEAIRLLRKGETAKALAVASMRCHYLEDSICIAHSDIWYPRDPGDVLTPGVPGKRVWSFMPQSAQGYWLPFDPRKPGFIHYDRLRIDPPPLQVESWDKLAKRKLSRNMHTFFDSTALHRGHKAGEFPLDHVPDTTNWSAYDYEIYARWRSDQIALEVLDRESVLQQKGDGWIKFAGAVSFQKAMDHEMENIIAAVSAYYRYLTVARDTEVGGGLDTLPRGEDHLLLMSLHKPAIYVADDAPWPLKRACRLLAFEMVRARHRSLGNFDAPSTSIGPRSVQNQESSDSCSSEANRQAARGSCIIYHVLLVLVGPARQGTTTASSPSLIESVPSDNAEHDQKPAPEQVLQETGNQRILLHSYFWTLRIGFRGAGRDADSSPCFSAIIASGSMESPVGMVSPASTRKGPITDLMICAGIWSTTHEGSRSSTERLATNNRWFMV